MNKAAQNKVFVAIKIWRGFIDQVQVFKHKKLAQQQVRLWRKEVTDIDDIKIIETEVQPDILSSNKV